MHFGNRNTLKDSVHILKDSVQTKCIQHKSQYHLRLVRVTIVVVFGFLPPDFGRWRELMNGTLSFYESMFSSGYTIRW